METKVALAALINHCTRLLENQNELSLEETEDAIVNENIVQLVQSRFGAKTDLAEFSEKMELSDVWKDVNKNLRDYIISEHTPGQLGKAARKWGVSKNGLALIIVLAAEILRDEKLVTRL